MNFPPDFLDEIRSRLPVSDVVARRVKLQRRGREFVGLSPFNPEKTPSFTVNDQKGFYHCFSSGKHGDIFTFVMETDGLSFPEAVEKLAGEVSIPMPRQSPVDVEREKKRQGIYEILEEAARFFEIRLQGKDGAAARRYMAERELEEPTIKRFRIGYAPAGRKVLREHFAAKGVSVAMLVEAGLLIDGEDIKEPYDRFRDRVIFPITNIKGEVIAFGGRALNPDVPAKYLNSPETPVFHKGAILYNHAAARKAAYESQGVIVCEGYMDVIALAMAGFDNAVAPLGTALTERQLQLLWRMAPEPVLCFDGDMAGLKAAWRVLDLALPELQPGRSLRFALLPEGLDPDDLVRQHGRMAMVEVLEKAVPMADMLWSREMRSGAWDTPERRAELEQRLESKVAGIHDHKVKHHYQNDLRARLKNLWERARVEGGGGFRGKAAGAGKRTGFARRGRGAGGTGALKQSLIGRNQGFYGSAAQGREAFLLLGIIDNPRLLDRHAEKLAEIKLTSNEMDQLRQAILDAASLQENLDRSQIIAHLADRGLGPQLERLDRARKKNAHPAAADTATMSGIETAWLQAAALHRRQIALAKELKAAELACGQELTEENVARLNEIRDEYNSLEGLEASFDEQDI